MRMDCPSCVRGIQARLERMPGVTQPEVLFARGQVRFCYDSEVVRPEQVIAALAEVGHRARLPEAQARCEAVGAEAASRPSWQEPRALRTAAAGV